MGCDIHFVLECKHDYLERYMEVYASDGRYGLHLPGFPDQAVPNTQCEFWDKFSDRDYSFFGELADVRREPTNGALGTPGLPDQATRLAVEAVTDADSHSLGHCSLETFFNAYAHATQPAGLTAQRKLQNLPLLVAQDSFNQQFMGNYRVIYWFDN
jgi:hypothetical protein